MKMKGFIVLFLSVVSVANVCLASQATTTGRPRKLPTTTGRPRKLPTTTGRPTKPPCLCRNGGTCHYSSGQPYCSCSFPFTGDHCEVMPTAMPTTLPPATAPTTKPRCLCQNGQKCHYSSGYPHCTCSFPYTGRHCEAHFCDAYQEPCDNGGTCVKDKSYVCICPPNYTGRYCRQPMPTTPPPATAPPTKPPCLCQNGGTCHYYSSGRPHCSCSFPYTGDHCETHFCDITNVFEHCANGGTCVKDKSKVCICPPNYTGRYCRQPMPTTPPPATAPPTKPPCLCQNGGTCHYYSSGRPHCTCSFPYTGDHCETHICELHPCANGGTCVKDKSNVCICPPNYTGRYCRQPMPTTATAPPTKPPCLCQNGGTCHYSSGRPHCSCSFPYTGDHCEAHFCDVMYEPCANGGTCVRDSPAPKCLCPPNYTGPECRQPLQPTPGCQCLNGGTCVHDGYHQRCICPGPYMGRRCQYKEVPICQATNPCQNGGTCVDLSQYGKYECRCPSGFSGQRCENKNH